MRCYKTIVIKDIGTILLNMKILSDVRRVRLEVREDDRSGDFADLYARCVEAPVLKGG